jgi:hypothetical protein
MYLLFSDSICFFCAYNMKKKSVAILHGARPAPAAAGMLIRWDGQLVLVESNLPDFCSCATPVVRELRGEIQAKNPLAQVVGGPYSIHAHPRPTYQLLFPSQLAT